MHTFYCPDAVLGGQVFLSEQEAAHCAKVLRLRQGERIEIIDGKGNKFIAEITLATKNVCSAKIIELQKNVFLRRYFNHIAVAPTKNVDRFEWMVEKAVEFGVDRITPLLCDHSERKVLKTDRLEKIIVSAVKQSGSVVMPVIDQLICFDDFLKSELPQFKFIAHCEDTQKQFINKVCIPECQSVVLIGPEGDFSPREIASALEVGFTPISLGNSRLRTETAGVAVCAFLAALNC